VFYLFDLLWSDGRDITGTTVLQRRDRLEQVINPVPGIQRTGRQDIIRKIPVLSSISKTLIRK
jgi:ATP-dependent DNA ligase